MLTKIATHSKKSTLLLLLLSLMLVVKILKMVKEGQQSDERYNDNSQEQLSCDDDSD